MSTLRKNLIGIVAVVALVLASVNTMLSMAQPMELERTAAQASQKLTALTELTAPTYEDLLYVVDDPSGTPLSRAATISNTGKAFVNLEPSGTISAVNYCGAAYFTHCGDADTYLGFDAADAFTLTVGGEAFIDVTEDGTQDEIILGNSTGDVDVRIQATGGITDALFVQGSSGKVGVHTTSPTGIVEIVGEVDTADPALLRLVANDTSIGSGCFIRAINKNGVETFCLRGTGTMEVYNTNGDQLIVEGNNALTVKQDGTVLLGTSADQPEQLFVSGSAQITGTIVFGPTDLALSDGDWITPTYTTYNLDTSGDVAITLGSGCSDGQPLFLAGDDANTITVNYVNVRTTDGAALAFDQYDVLGFMCLDSEWLLMFENNLQ